MLKSARAITIRNDGAVNQMRLLLPAGPGGYGRGCDVLEGKDDTHANTDATLTGYRNYLEIIRYSAGQQSLADTAKQMKSNDTQLLRRWAVNNERKSRND